MTSKLQAREVFPAASVAVYVTVVVPTAKMEPGRCDFVHTSDPTAVQLSVPVGSTQLTTASQLPGSFAWVIAVGQPASTGSSLSLTVTSKLQAREVFPAASVAVYVTVVVPTAKMEPGRCDFVHTSDPTAVQLSVPVGSTQLTTASQLPGSFAWVIAVGQPASTGSSLSLTVTSKLH